MGETPGVRVSRAEAGAPGPEPVQALQYLEGRERSEPGNALLKAERGNVLARLQRPVEAERAWKEALALEPDCLPAHQPLIQMLYDLGRWEEYEAELDRFDAVNPGSPFLEYERGYLNLLRGNMAVGWRQWEARLRAPGFVPPEKQFSQPRWLGEGFAGRTLLVTYEQGFGDTLMLVRYLPRVKALGGRVLLLVQPQFAYLMTTLQGVDEIVPFGNPIPPFDLQVSLFSLPAVFGTELGSIPCDIPYLGLPRAVPTRRELAEALAPSHGLVRIGLVWGGSPRHPRDDQRSIPPGLLDPLGDLPGVAWHSFQLGREDRPSMPNLVDLAPLLKTFSDTAYGLSGMDLLITVDTAIAHLAGALGIPTLLLVTYAPDFRWMLDREDSPWYPSMRIFRQSEVGNWNPVIQRLVSALES